MRVICWLRGHRWFDTVLTHAAFYDWGPLGGDPGDRHVLGVFHEHICLRCGHQEAVFQRELTTYDPFYDYMPTPEWLDAPPEHFPLPGDWAA